LTKDISFKAAGTIYSYLGHGTTNAGGTNTPGFSSTYVGAGATLPTNGPSGYPTGFPTSQFTGTSYDGFAYNQTGINNLLIVEIPWEVNFHVLDHRLKFFGDWAENLQGTQRALAASAAAANPLIYGPYTLKVPVERGQNLAYQFGIAVGNGDELGQAYGSGLKRGVWELRAYWQHIDQYALDPNLVDSDFFEGAENLQGLYVAFAYSFTDAIEGTIRYGYASRIDKKLGTGSSDQDIPQINPFQQYQVMQVDLSLKL